jgi:hypothetical protein
LSNFQEIKGSRRPNFTKDFNFFIKKYGSRLTKKTGVVTLIQAKMFIFWVVAVAIFLSTVNWKHSENWACHPQASSEAFCFQYFKS